MSEQLTVMAGDCTIVDSDSERRELRGRVVVVVKPDGTVLVHDVTGYQPVAWLTRADEVRTTTDGTTTIEARTGGRRLRIRAHDGASVAGYDASRAGPRIGSCPSCAGALVREGDARCIDCSNRYGLPADATVIDQRCDCGLPRIRVERGLQLDVCIDRQCESIDDAVAEAFDRSWSCPDCGADLRIIRRGGLLAGCDAYPECEVAFAFPTGVIDGECSCGLPRFATGGGHRCLDRSCDAWLPDE